MIGQAGQESVEYTLTVSDALNQRLTRMAAANGGDPREVLAKAIALYEVACTARTQACFLAVLDANNQIQTKIEGL
jgi:predicted transcriptional regulator